MDIKCSNYKSIKYTYSDNNWLYSKNTCDIKNNPKPCIFFNNYFFLIFFSNIY